MFRWFVGLGIDDPVWVPTVFTKDRDRLLTTEMSRKVMAAILAHREVAPLLSDEHFSVDGTLVKAWASMQSFQPKADAAPPDDEGPGDPPTANATLEPAPSETTAETDPMPRNTKPHRNAEVDFKGEKRSNATHASTTDPDARLYKKSPGTGAMLCFIGHALMENRNGLIVRGNLTQADGHAERTAALNMVHRHSPGSTGPRVQLARRRQRAPPRSCASIPASAAPAPGPPTRDKVPARACSLSCSQPIKPEGLAPGQLTDGAKINQTIAESPRGAIRQGQSRNCGQFE